MPSKTGPTKTQMKQMRKQAKDDAKRALATATFLTLDVVRLVLAVTDIDWVVQQLQEFILAGRRVEQDAQDTLCEEADEKIRHRLSDALFARARDLEGDAEQERRKRFFHHFATALLNQEQRTSRSIDELLRDGAYAELAGLVRVTVFAEEDQDKLARHAGENPDGGEELAILLREEAELNRDSISEGKAAFLIHVAERLEDQARLRQFRPPTPERKISQTIPAQTAPVQVVDETEAEKEDESPPESGEAARPSAASAADERAEAAILQELDAIKDLSAAMLAKRLLENNYVPPAQRDAYCRLFAQTPDLTVQVMEQIHGQTRLEQERAKKLWEGGEPNDARTSAAITRRLRFYRDVLGGIFRSAAFGKAEVQETEGGKAESDSFPGDEPGSQAA